MKPKENSYLTMFLHSSLMVERISVVIDNHLLESMSTKSTNGMGWLFIYK